MPTETPVEPLTQEWFTYSQLVMGILIIMLLYVLYTLSKKNKKLQEEEAEIPMEVYPRGEVLSSRVKLTQTTTEKKSASETTAIEKKPVSPRCFKDKKILASKKNRKLIRPTKKHTRKKTRSNHLSSKGVTGKEIASKAVTVLPPTTSPSSSTPVPVSKAKPTVKKKRRKKVLPKREVGKVIPMHLESGDETSDSSRVQVI